MNKILVFFATLCISISSMAQIVIQPSGQNGFASFTAGINGENNKPFWIGVGKYPHIYLDSSENHKVGIGSTIKGPNFTFKHNYHAKLHVRHVGGSGSNFNTQIGPHLLLDEATTVSPAVLRFRQSSTTTSGVGQNLEENLVIGARYWDIRGFANGPSISSDYLKFVNNGNANDVFSLTGDGELTLTGDNNPQLILKNTSSGSIKKIEFGEVGEGSNGGRIWYANSALSLYANSKRSLNLSSEGFVTIGSHSLAPSIKTWYNTINLSFTSGILTGMTLPANQIDILSVNIMFNDINGITKQILNWEIDDTTLYINNTEGAFGMNVRVFVTYREQPN